MKEKLTVSFNISFLKESAISLARNHKVSATTGKLKPIKPILEGAKQTLTETYRTLSKMLISEKEISPASEWLLDNFYIIQEQIVQIGIDFPKTYQKDIPILTIGEHKGFPRIYEIVLNMLTHTDNVLDNEVLVEYIRSYQEEKTLQLGELWAIPIMIRFFLIQILTEKASRILEGRNIKVEVERFVNKIEKENLQEPGAFAHAISGWAKDHSGKSGLLHLFELFNQLQSIGLLQEEQKRWFNYHINQYDITLEGAMRLEAQKQSRLQVNIQNAIISLREIAETDWSDFVEDCSVFNSILKQDPAGHYAKMDFQTRDSYRRSVEKLSRHSDLEEHEISDHVLQLAKAQTLNSDENHEDLMFDKNRIKQHVGYYLVGDGYSELIEKVGYITPLRERFYRTFESHFYLYLLAIFLFALSFVGVLAVATGAISYSPAVIIAVILFSFFPALELSIYFNHELY
jgi:cyclic beta-1,2-glucan synthetase